MKVVNNLPNLHGNSVHPCNNIISKILLVKCIIQELLLNRIIFIVTNLLRNYDNLY